MAPLPPPLVLFICVISIFLFPALKELIRLRRKAECVLCACIFLSRSFSCLLAFCVGLSHFLTILVFFIHLIFPTENKNESSDFVLFIALLLSKAICFSHFSALSFFRTLLFDIVNRQMAKEIYLYKPRRKWCTNEKFEREQSERKGQKTLRYTWDKI